MNATVAVAVGVRVAVGDGIAVAVGEGVGVGEGVNVASSVGEGVGPGDVWGVATACPKGGGGVKAPSFAESPQATSRSARPANSWRTSETLTKSPLSAGWFGYSTQVAVPTT